MNKPDVIDRAAELIRLRAFTKQQGHWRTITDTLELGYIVEREYCDCPFWQYKNAGAIEGQIVCKHQCCIFGAAVVLFVVEIRAADSLDALFAAVRGHQEAVKLALPEYRAIADREYRIALERLETSATAIISEPVKQPKVKRQQKYDKRTVNRGDEHISMIQVRQEPEYFNGIQIR